MTGTIGVPEGELTGASDLYLQATEGGEPVRLTHPPDDEGASVWSPSGGRVAFVRMGADQAHRSRCRIVVQLVPQGQEREVARCNVAFFTGRVSWSAKGDRIIFTDYRASNADVAYLRIVDLATGGSQDLVPGSMPGNNSNAVFSSDGRRIAFMHYSGAGIGDAYAYETATGSLKRVTRNGAWGFLDWTPDGRSLLVATQRDGAFGLWQAPLDAGRPAHRLGLELQNLGRISQGGGYV